MIRDALPAYDEDQRQQRQYPLRRLRQETAEAKGGVTHKTPETEMHAGDRVITSDGEGTILSISSYGYAHVVFDDGQVRKYPVRRLRTTP